MVTRHGTAVGRVWADDPGTGKRRDLTFEEEQAFWAGRSWRSCDYRHQRIEELLELTHHSLVHTGCPPPARLVPLLQIAPSKTDIERLLPID